MAYGETTSEPSFERESGMTRSLEGGLDGPSAVHNLYGRDIYGRAANEHSLAVNVAPASLLGCKPGAPSWGPSVWMVPLPGKYE